MAQVQVQEKNLRLVKDKIILLSLSFECMNGGHTIKNISFDDAEYLHYSKLSELFLFPSSVSRLEKTSVKTYTFISLERIFEAILAWCYPTFMD